MTEHRPGDCIRCFEPGPDQLAVTVDFLGRPAVTAIFDLADIDCIVANVDGFVAEQMPGVDRQEKFNMLLDAVGGMISKHETTATLMRAIEGVLWVCMRDDRAPEVKRGITAAVMSRGFAHLTVASNEYGKIAFGVGAYYVPLREFPEVFSGEDVTVGPGFGEPLRC